MTDTESDRCATVEEEPEYSPTELSGERGTGVLSHAAEQDACLLQENGSDQSVYSCPSPTDEGGDDLENMAASPPLQVWFDTEVLEALESDNLDVEQRSDQMFKSSRQKRSQTTPNSSRVLILGRWRVSVRSVTELIVDDGQQADESRKTWLNEVDGLIRCMKSAKEDRETVEKQT